MFRRFSVNFMIFSIALDFLLVSLNLGLANLLRPQLSRLPFATTILAPLDLPWPLFVLFPLVWVFLLIWSTVYDGQRNFRLVDEMTNLSFGSLLASVSMAGVLYLSYRNVSRLVFISFAGSTFTLMVAWRLLMRLLFRWDYFRSATNRKMLIVGGGEIGHDLYVNIKENQAWNVDIVGFLSDGVTECFSHSEKVLGGLEDIRKVIEFYKIDDVVLALSLSAQERINNLVFELHELPVKVWVIPNYFTLALYKAEVVDYAGMLMLDLRAPALSENQRLVKRVFDIMVTIISLPFTLSIMGLVAIAILLDSPGAVIFKQQRVGENGRLFTMYKFRTMVKDAEELRHSVERTDENGNVIHKIQNDPRLTRTGKFLRKTSLDELPQLFNVLKGDMSLIGPRPELPYLVKQYQAWQRKRFAVPQGITGWWQVNGRSDRPMHLHTEDDLFYIHNYSMWLDLQILLKTVWVALTRKGAF
ncbi:MAG: sugar transferase [Anaerolineales bacterium]|jgi:exopolysaccharide biosynthesis polyprenyl glycosylphosphotransferase|nr:sugar transferase [Anaerolineales bacterium]